MKWQVKRDQFYHKAKKMRWDSTTCAATAVLVSRAWELSHCSLCSSISGESTEGAVDGSNERVLPRELQP